MTSKNDEIGRVAIVLPDLRGGGVERVRLILANEFLDLGFSVDLVLARVAGELLGDVPDRCRVIDLAAPRFRSVWPALHKYLRRERPRGVLAAMWPLTGIACFAARTSRVPFKLVVSEHNDFRMAPAITQAERHVLKLLGRWIYEPAAAVVAVSRGVEESLHQCAGLNHNKTRVIYSPFRQPIGGQFLSDDAPLLDWWNGASARLLTVGTLKAQKAHDVLLCALSKLRSHCDARLIILGDGPLRPETEELIVKLRLEDRVRMPGFRLDPFPFMTLADLFVLSSAWEGFGNVLIEAMACGTPVVSTDCPSGPREALADGVYGTLVPPNDPGKLAQAIAEALRRPADAERLKFRSRQFSPRSAAQSYLEAMFGPGNSEQPS